NISPCHSASPAMRRDGRASGCRRGSRAFEGDGQLARSVFAAVTGRDDSRRITGDPSRDRTSPLLASDAFHSSAQGLANHLACPLCPRLPLRWRAAGNQRDVPKAAVSNRSKSAPYSIASSARPYQPGAGREDTELGGISQPAGQLCSKTSLLNHLVG